MRLVNMLLDKLSRIENGEWQRTANEVAVPEPDSTLGSDHDVFARSGSDLTDFGETL
jgi:hypothetical protein